MYLDNIVAMSMYQADKQFYFRYILFLVGSIHFLPASAQQDTLSSIFGNGVRFVTKDSSFYAKLSFRMQLNYTAEFNDIEHGDINDDFQDRMRVRRSRLKIDGFVYDPRVQFKFEYDMVNSVILDAAIKWNFSKHFELWFGQTKLPSNRERITSSQNLQLVDRSLLNSRFTIDRDKGLQLHYTGNIGKAVLRQAVAVSQGEGIFNSANSQGHEITAKFEVLPMGAFASKGEYEGGDLKREATPKLALAFTFDHNARATQQRGQLGSVVGIERDLQTLIGDMVFKYKGTSLMAEYAQRLSVSGTPELRDTTGAIINSFYTGNGANVQIGHLFKNNWEVALRYSFVEPKKVIEQSNETHYTIGVSKYIVGHSLKVQSDVTLIEMPEAPQAMMFRLQAELAF